MNIKKEYTLRNGVNIPAIGFGTWQIPNGEEAYQSVRWALEAGYRHIDTAAAYGNETSVGKAIRDSGLKREEVFITSKLKAELKGYQTALDEFAGTLKRLGVEYLDLYLIHAPKPWDVNSDGLEYTALNIETWKAFIDLHKAGKIRAIGVSNFMIPHLRPLIEATGFAPHVNQVFLCPGDPKSELDAFSKPYGMLIEAYSPFATGRIFMSEKLQGMATKYQKSMAQVALRWSLQRGFLPLPKSVTMDRIKSNLDVYDFSISDVDMLELDQLKLPFRHR
jgi:diketogulonate reductase-like aldo/keto reductase